MSLTKILILSLSIIFFSGCNQPANSSYFSDAKNNYSPLETYISTNTEFTPAFLNNPQVINEFLLGYYPSSDQLKITLAKYDQFLSSVYHFYWQTDLDQNQTYSIFVKLKQPITPDLDDKINNYHLSQNKDYLIISTSTDTPALVPHPEQSFLTINSLNNSSFEPATLTDLNLISTVKYLPLNFYSTNNQITINHPEWPIVPRHTLFNNINHQSLDFLTKSKLNHIINSQIKINYLTINQFQTNSVTDFYADEFENLNFIYTDSTKAQEIFENIKATLKLQSVYQNQLSTLPDNTATTLFSAIPDEKISVSTADNSISYLNQNNTSITIKLTNNQIEIINSLHQTLDQTNTIPVTYLSNLLPKSDTFLHKFKSLQFQINNNQINGYLVK